jgi:uncharacterized protein YndB with AHSA1/START domain
MSKSSKLDMIAEPGKHEFTLTRKFKAPRALVYQTYTDAAAIPQWWGPRGLTTVVDKMEVKPGGQWRFVQHDSEGNEFGFHGFYHQVIPSERLISTFEWEGLPGHVLLETTTFEDYEGGTKVVSSSVFQTVEDRDGMLQSGMEGGAEESLERLTELLEKALAGTR